MWSNPHTGTDTDRIREGRLRAKTGRRVGPGAVADDGQAEAGVVSGEHAERRQQPDDC